MLGKPAEARCLRKTWEMALQQTIEKLVLSMNPESFLLGNNLFSCLTLPFQIYQAYLGHKPSKHFQNIHPKVATRMCSSTTILINPIPTSYYHQVFFLQIYCLVTFPREAS